MRLGLTTTRNAVKAERELVAAVPKRHWIAWSHWLIHHGRAVCRARKPDCDGCLLAPLCPKVGVEPRRKADERQPARKKSRRVSRIAPKAYTRRSERSP
jgi:adenine-specific DNA glycosylase